jgi:DNA-directed RNA polymerase subunit K/omega
MELETPHIEETNEDKGPVEPAPLVSNRFLFVDIAALRAKQLRRGARPRLDRALTAHENHPQPHKAERVAMEEVRQQLVHFDLPAAKPPVHNPETGV